MITIRGDYTVFSINGGFHSNSNGFLTIVEMAETTDEFGFVERVSSDLHTTHENHVVEEGHEFGGGGLDGGGRWFAVVGSERDGGFDG